VLRDPLLNHRVRYRDYLVHGGIESPPRLWALYVFRLGLHGFIIMALIERRLQAPYALVFLVRPYINFALQNILATSCFVWLPNHNQSQPNPRG
jgi:hypothetical protein